MQQPPRQAQLESLGAALLQHEKLRDVRFAQIPLKTHHPMDELAFLSGQLLGPSADENRKESKSLEGEGNGGVTA